MRGFTMTILALTSMALSAADPPQAEISNGPIRAKLYLPDAKNGYYRGTRFDWSGVVASLVYQGHDYYGAWFQRMDPKVRDYVDEGTEIVASPCSAITGPVDEFSTNGRGLGGTTPNPAGPLSRSASACFARTMSATIITSSTTSWTPASGPSARAAISWSSHRN